MMENQTQTTQLQASTVCPATKSKSISVTQLLYFAILLLFLALIPENAAAKIWRVNNTGDVTADFTSIQEAIDNAGAGDTIHVEPSSIVYSKFEASKRITILGSGYFLNENDSTQNNLLSSKVDNKFNVSAANVYISGLTFTQTLSFQSNISASNVTITKCFFTAAQSLNINFGNFSNINISNNYISNNIRGTAGSTCSNCRIENNYVEGDITARGGSFIIAFNIIGNSINADNSTIQNNIFRTENNATTLINGSGNTIQNNLTALNQLDEADGNIKNADLSTVFVGSSGNSTDGQYQLSENSPAKGSGLQGIDMGMFGGGSPYILSGIPPIPHIYELTVPTQTSKEAGLTISIKAKSN